ncbi:MULTISPECIES: hypothetical protein [Vagococcus]|uniref:Uncharacterized protein n=1 Tax=Vagococcus fluvialis bH819 TaxID=1255619 RepID=A0A1X6WL78_9ENTE|nr:MULTISPECIES: hypothetical protein [Vagococcus]SLM84992.1 hypothetical protein FM121_02775 [Vagococcus fluvialis bH819]HCM88591.1 hypothetical protein [Vagococcus sp.]
MEYMGELNILQWTGEYFIQIPTGFKEKGLEEDNIMAIVRDAVTSKEIKDLKDMESLSTSLPLKKKTAKEVIGKIAKDAADQGMSFLVDTLIETTLDIDMGTDNKNSIFSELFTMVMDQEERSYIASIGKYEKNQLFFESIIPTSETIQKFFKTEYEADFFTTHVALNTFECTGEFEIEELTESFFDQIIKTDKIKAEVERLIFSYKGFDYVIQRMSARELSYNLFTMDIDLEKK